MACSTRHGGRFDLPAVRTLFEQLNGGSAQLNDIEIEHLSERGELRTVSVNASRLQTPDYKRLILMAFEDVTERKRTAEARYRRLFESARDGILLVDANSGQVIDLNPYTERLLGYAQSELVGRQLWDIELMRNVPNMHAVFEQIRDRGVVRLDDLTIRTNDGHDLLTEVIANTYL